MNHKLHRSNDMRDDLQNLGLNIVKGFHEQFAQNQNHHQNLFLQALTVLLTALIGFGFVYIRVQPSSVADKLSGPAIVATSATMPSSGGKIPAHGGNIVSAATTPNLQPQSPPPAKTDIYVTIETLHAFLALATLLLTLGIALICNMALGFRRDQMVAANIRMLAGVMRQEGEPLEVLVSNSKDFFPGGFNPVRNRGIWDWMPEFHKIFLLTLFLVQILLSYSVFSNPNFATQKCSEFTLTMDKVTYFFIGLGVVTFLYYWWKWVNTAVKGMPRLQLKEDKLRDFILGKPLEQDNSKHQK